MDVVRTWRSGTRTVTLRGPFTSNAVAKWLAIVANATVVHIGTTWELDGVIVTINNPSSIKLITFNVCPRDQSDAFGDLGVYLTFDEFVDLVRFRTLINPPPVKSIEISTDGVQIDGVWCQEYANRATDEWGKALAAALH